MRLTTSPSRPAAILVAVKGTVLRIAGSYHRHGIGSQPAGVEGRQETGGPLVPGPWALAFGLCTVMCSNPEQSTGSVAARNRAAGLEHDVSGGELVAVDGYLYRVRIERRQWIKLDAVEVAP